MNRAYPVYRLENTASNMGEAMDYAVNAMHLTPQSWIQMLVNSSMREKLEKGELFDPRKPDPLFHDGADLVKAAATESGRPEPYPVFVQDLGYYKDYWTGMILAWLQWYTGMSYSQLVHYLPVEEIRNLYSDYHYRPEEDMARLLLSRMPESMRG